MVSQQQQAYLVLDETALTTALLPPMVPLEPAKEVNASALLSNARTRATPENPRLLDMIQALKDGTAVRDVTSQDAQEVSQACLEREWNSVKRSKNRKIRKKKSLRKEGYFPLLWLLGFVWKEFNYGVPFTGSPSHTTEPSG